MITSTLLKASIVLAFICTVTIVVADDDNKPSDNGAAVDLAAQQMIDDYADAWSRYDPNSGDGADEGLYMRVRFH